MANYFIGFSNKYYTLWTMSIETRTIGYNTYNIHYYNYIKNLSMDKDVAFEKAPKGAVYNELLRGKSASFEKREWIIDNDKFHNGKYNGMLFTECSDYEYLAWFFSSVATFEQRKNIIPILEANGYKYDEHGLLWTPDELAEIAKHNDRIATSNEILKNNNPITIDIKCNVDENGEYYDCDSEIKIKFPEIQGNYYRGFEYYLPVMNGKAKRIKNKTITITKYNKLDDLFIEVVEFSVNKN